MRMIVALALLGVVLAFAVRRPWNLPEAAAAVPAAAIAVLTGLVPWPSALAEIRSLSHTVAFLAAVLLLAHLADRHGVFAWAGQAVSRQSRGSPRRMLTAVFVAASLTTAVLSLDATVVLLTPVVLAAAARSRPYVYACLHLANSASLLLPVSNLTNLLAFAASGLTFLTFAAVMAPAWLLVIVIEYAVFRVYFAGDLAGRSPTSSRFAGRSPAPSRFAGRSPAPSRFAGRSSAPFRFAGRLPTPSGEASSDGPSGSAGGAASGGSSDRARGAASHDTRDSAPVPRYAVTVLALTLAGFAVLQPLGVEPAWVALAGAAALLVRSGTTVAGVIRAANPAFCVFVLALGVIVLAVTENGLGPVVAALIPQEAGLPAMLAVAALAAVLANLLNNLPATLLLLPAVSASPPLLLAMLIGVNIGPNLTYAGSLATLLWRRILHDRDSPPRSRDLFRLGAWTVPLTIPAAVVALWATLHLIHI